MTNVNSKKSFNLFIEENKDKLNLKELLKNPSAFNFTFEHFLKYKDIDEEEKYEYLALNESDATVTVSLYIILVQLKGGFLLY